MDVVDRVRREIERNALRARNGIQIARGVDPPRVGQTPKDVMWRSGRCELWRYRSDSVRHSPPLLIVYSLFNRSYVMDLAPGNSFVARLVEAGFDVYLLDWGVPDVRDAANTLEDYVDDYIPAAVGEIRRRSGHEQINLLGYCVGGLLSAFYAARYASRATLRSLTVLTTPADLHRLGPMVSALMSGGLSVEKLLDRDGNVPPGLLLQAFRSLAPTSDITMYVDLLERLWNDEYVAAHRAMTAWAMNHVPLPGGVARDFERMVKTNAVLNDSVSVGGEPLSLSRIEVPFLHVLARRDHVIPESSSRPLLDLIGSREKDEIRLDSGHIGLVVGRSAARTTIPTIIDFLQQRTEVIT